MPRPLTPHSGVSLTPHRCASSSEGSSPRPVPNWLSSPATAITPSSRTERATHWNWKPTTADTPRSRTRSATLKYGVGLNHLPLRALCRQRRLDGRAGTGPQPGPLDGPHRSGGAGGDHQDPQTTLVLPGRTAYTLGAPSHSASPAALALGDTVRPRTGQTANHSVTEVTA